MALSADLHPDEIADGYERALVGGLLWDPERPLPPLLADEFFLERHRVIWTAMGELGILGVGHALPALTEHLRQRNQLQEARGVRGLGEELAGTGMPAGAIRERLDALPAPVSLASPRDRWREVQARWGKSGLQVGLPDVDRKLGGLFPGDLVVVGGRPSHGKTALLVSVALHAGVEEGLGVAYLTLEMSAAAVFRRFLGARARLRLVALRGGALGPSEFELADQTADWLTTQPLSILDARSE